MMIKDINILFVLDWLEHHQVVAASLINVSVVLIVSISTNQLQFHRETQRWQREKLYDLYQEAQGFFSDLLKSRGAIQDSYLQDFHLTVASLSKLTLVCSNQDVDEIESIKTELIDLIQPVDSSGFRHVKLAELYPLSERLNKVIANDSRLKDLFK